jgi:hypothetical protein
MDAIINDMRNAGTAFISSDVSDTRTASGSTRRVLIRDPDGHAVELVEAVDDVDPH